MTRHTPVLHGSHIFAVFDDAIASRAQELALAKRIAYIQSLRDGVCKFDAANEEALAGRTQELALDSQKTHSQNTHGQNTRGESCSSRNAIERIQGVEAETEVQKRALAHNRMQRLALLSQNVPRQPYRHNFSKMRSLANNALNEEAKRNALAYTEPLPAPPPSLPIPTPCSDHSSDFDIVPATYDDIPELVQIHIDAYEFDQMTLLLRQSSGKSVEDYRRELTEMVRKTWGKSWGTSWIWVARRTSDGEALGCAAWVIHDKAGKEETMKRSMNDGEQTMEDVFRQMRFGPGGAGIEGKSMASDGNESSSRAETPAPPRKDLNDYSHARLLAMHERWVPAQTRYLYLGSLAVSSRHQSHGVGGALLRQGMTRADSEGLLIWLEATPAGHPVYEHYGWKTVESVSVRLQDFIGNPGEQSGWGTYRMNMEKEGNRDRVDKEKREKRELSEEQWWRSWAQTDLAKAADTEEETQEQDQWQKDHAKIDSAKAAEWQRMQQENEQWRRDYAAINWPAAVERERQRRAEKREASRKFSGRVNERRAERERIKEQKKKQREEEKDEMMVHTLRTRWWEQKERERARRTPIEVRLESAMEVAMIAEWEREREIEMIRQERKRERERAANREEELRQDDGLLMRLYNDERN